MPERHQRCHACGVLCMCVDFCARYRADSIKEAARVLKPGGFLVFTDIMQSDDCNLEQMAPVFARINLDDMGSPAKSERARGAPAESRTASGSPTAPETPPPANVNVVEEMVNMIETQRAYEMNSKAISTADQMLQYVTQNL